MMTHFYVLVPVQYCTYYTRSHFVELKNILHPELLQHCVYFLLLRLHRTFKHHHQ